MLPDPPPKGALGLYIHVPFCLRKCDYCAFASAPPRPGEIDRWLGRIASELEERLAPAVADRVTTVFVGGGNPTAIGGKALSALIDQVLPRLVRAPLTEWTFESNPETLDAENLRALARVPRLRLSIGGQRLRDDELRGLGRTGSVETVFRALESALGLTKRVGLDLILGVPGFPSLAPDLAGVLERFPLAHVSAYFLSAEPGTPLDQKVQDGTFPDPGEVGPEELFDVADLLARHGFEHYEISNFARPGERCRHNLLYWHNHDYIGIGPAAVGTMNGQRTTNPESLAAWLAGEPPRRESLDATTQAHEFIMLRLRLLSEGLDLVEFRRRFGEPSADLLANLHHHEAAGRLSREGELWRLSRPGLALANQVIADLFC